MLCTSVLAKDVYVNGYTRSDGTYVSGHYRSAPNSTINDNFSTEGNVNPYTGKEGWVSREGYDNGTTSPSATMQQNADTFSGLATMSTLGTSNFTEYTADIDDASEDSFLTLLGGVGLGTMIILTIILKTVVRPFQHVRMMIKNPRQYSEMYRGRTGEWFSDLLCVLGTWGLVGLMITYITIS